MRTGFKYIQLLFLLAWALSTHAQVRTIEYHHFNTKDGLGNDMVFRLHVDQRGFLWAGTDNGLSRFNGEEFCTYRFRNEVSKNQVLGIWETTKDDFLINYYREGIFQFRNGKLNRWEPSRSLTTKNVVQLAGRDSMPQWLFSHNQLFLRKGAVFEEQNGLTDPGRAWSENQKWQGIYWVGGAWTLVTGNSIWVWNDMHFRRVWRSEAGQALSKAHVTSSGNLLLGIDDQLLSWNLDSTSIVCKSPDSMRINIVFEDREKRLWYSTMAGNWFLWDGQQSLHLNEQLGIPPILLNDIAEDANGSIWLASFGQGIYQVNMLEDLEIFSMEKLGPPSYLSSLLPCGPDSIWVGGFNKLYLILNGSWQQLDRGPKQAGSRIFDLRPLPGNRVRLVSGNIADFDPIHGISDFLPVEVDAICWLTDGADPKMVGGYRGARAIEGKSWTSPPHLQALNEARVSSMAQTSKRRWYASDLGLYYENRSAKPPKLERSVLETKSINTLFVDSRDVLWAATVQGIFYYKDEVWNMARSTYPAAELNSFAFAEDQQHRLWAGTASGLFLITPEAHLQKVSLPHYNLDRSVYSLAVDVQGRILAGEFGRIVRFHSKQVVNQLDRGPGIFVDSILVEGSRFPKKKSIQLPYANRRIGIHYAGISLDRANELFYEFRLLGSGDTNWRSTQARFLEFNALSPGRYQLEVRAGYHNMSMRSNTIQLPFEVLQPYWQKAWFILLVAGLLISLVFGLFRWREKARLKRWLRETGREREMNQLRQQAVAAMMNPHFIFNSLNAIRYYVKRYDKEVVSKYITQIAQLIRLQLAHAEQLNVPLGEELERVQLYLDILSLQHRDRFTYTIHIHSSINTAQVSLPHLLLQPFVENALWHGILPAERQGHIQIEVKPVANDQLHIRIRDNGIGLSQSRLQKDKKHSSMSIRLTRERLNLLGSDQTLHIRELSESTDGTTGTEVEILLQTLQVDIQPESTSPIPDSKTV